MVSGQGGERVEEVAEAGDGQAVLGALAGCFPPAGGRALRRGDWVGGGEWGVVFEEERGEALLELEAEGVGEHAEEDVGAHAVFEVVVDGADLELRALHRPEGQLDVGELLVRAHYR